MDPTAPQLDDPTTPEPEPEPSGPTSAGLGAVPSAEARRPAGSEPEPEPEPEPQQARLPWGWDTAHSKRTGRLYYWNVIDGSSSYSVPTKPAVPDAEILPSGVAGLEAAEAAEAAGDHVAALAGYNTAVAEGVALLERHPSLRPLVDALMDRALSLRPLLLAENERPAPSRPARQLISLSAAAAATPDQAGFRAGGDRSPASSRARRKSRGFKSDPSKRPANRRAAFIDDAPEMGAESPMNDSHLYDCAHPLRTPPQPLSRADITCVFWQPESRGTIGEPAPPRSSAGTKKARGNASTRRTRAATCT